MSRNRSRSIVVAGLTALVLLFGQTFLCFAEQASLIPCIHECSDSHDAGPVKDASGDCDATACHSVFVAVTHDFSMPVVSAGDELFAPDRSVPDGPVWEIDYPPQLS